MAAAPRTQLIEGEFDGSRWEAALRDPIAPLQPFVRAMVGYYEQSPRPQSQRQFPQPTVTVIIEFGPPLRVAMRGEAASAGRHTGGFVAGLSDAFAVTDHEGEQRGVQIDMTPTGARRLFRMPMSELSGVCLSLTDLLPGICGELCERLAESPSWATRLDLVEHFLAKRLLDAPVDTRYVDWALDRIREKRGLVDVGRLGKELGYSHKHVITLFRDQVGVRPKLLARLVRFDCVMSEVRAGRARPWIELAAEHGFSDQAHLAREVRHFTGLSPTLARESFSELAGLIR